MHSIAHIIDLFNHGDVSSRKISREGIFSSYQTAKIILSNVINTSYKDALPQSSIY